jgi:hypothetical protein
MNRIRNSRELEKCLKEADCEIRNGHGSHRVATLPDGSKLAYYESGEYPKGMAHKLAKILASAGLLILALAWLLAYGVL